MKKLLLFIMLFLSVLMPVCAEERASAQFSVTLPKYVSITPLLSPVLTANVMNRTGNLQMPLVTKFRVISNSDEKKTLYLKSSVTTDAGKESSMFEQGGTVYIAFANLANIPKSQSLWNCINGGSPKTSPGIVAYPIISVTGAEHKFVRDKYEVYTKNGITDVSVNVGTQVLSNSFSTNDPKGFYQAIISLTEADI